MRSGRSRSRGRQQPQSRSRHTNYMWVLEKQKLFMHAPSICIYKTHTHTHIYNGSACVCVCGTFLACPACLLVCLLCLLDFVAILFIAVFFFASLWLLPERDSKRDREREREGCCVHMLVHVHMQLSCFCFTSTFIFSCRFLRPFLMRRKMKSFSGFFSGRFPATSLSATVCLLFCTQMLTFFSLALALSLSLSVSGCRYSTYLHWWTKSFFGFLFAGRQARQAGRGKGWRGGVVKHWHVASILLKYCVKYCCCRGGVAAAECVGFFTCCAKVGNTFLRSSVFFGRPKRNFENTKNKMKYLQSYKWQ